MFENATLLLSIELIQFFFFLITKPVEAEVVSS